MKPGDCLAVCAFVDPHSELAAAVGALRHRLGRELGVASTLGFGPRFLHSTGQLNKGGPASIVVLQIVSETDAADDVAIPGQSFGFASFKQAQAAGDLEALRSAGKRAERVSVTEIAR